MLIRDWSSDVCSSDRRFGIALALLPPLLLVLLFQLALAGSVLGLPALVFGIVALFYAWGPRDLAVDVDAVVEAGDPVARHDAAARLWPAGAPGSLAARKSIVEGERVAGRVAIWGQR